tara:strand:+ start:861 stop:1046 length:186 start_codon:yes stop_codon:yes gene_type:complete
MNDLETEGMLLDLMLEAQDAVKLGTMPFNPTSIQRTQDQAELVSGLMFNKFFGDSNDSDAR